jgi:hypothetical protein
MSHCKTFLLLLTLTALLPATLGCNLLQRLTASTSASDNPLVGRWKSTTNGMITEYTETQMIVDLGGKITAFDYDLVNKNTYHLLLEGARDVNFTVFGDTLTIHGADGIDYNYTRVK